MVQPFGEEAFKLKVNEITLFPVKTLGCHIIYVEERKVRPIEKVTMEIENYLKVNTN